MKPPSYSQINTVAEFVNGVDLDEVPQTEFVNGVDLDEVAQNVLFKSLNSQSDIAWMKLFFLLKFCRCKKGLE